MNKKAMATLFVLLSLLLTACATTIDNKPDRVEPAMENLIEADATTTDNKPDRFETAMGNLIEAESFLCKINIEEAGSDADTFTVELLGKGESATDVNIYVFVRSEHARVALVENKMYGPSRQSSAPAPAPAAAAAPTPNIDLPVDSDNELNEPSEPAEPDKIDDNSIPNEITEIRELLARRDANGLYELAGFERELGLKYDELFVIIYNYEIFLHIASVSYLQRNCFMPIIVM